METKRRKNDQCESETHDGLLKSAAVRGDGSFSMRSLPLGRQHRFVAPISYSDRAVIFVGVAIDTLESWLQIAT